MAFGLIAFLIVAYILWCLYIRNDLVEMTNSSVLNSRRRTSTTFELRRRVSPVISPKRVSEVEPEHIPSVEEIQYPVFEIVPSLTSQQVDNPIPDVAESSNFNFEEEIIPDVKEEDTSIVKEEDISVVKKEDTPNVKEEDIPNVEENQYADFEIIPSVPEEMDIPIPQAVEASNIRATDSKLRLHDNAPRESITGQHNQIIIDEIVDNTAKSEFASIVRQSSLYESNTAAAKLSYLPSSYTIINRNTPPRGNTSTNNNNIVYPSILKMSKKSSTEYVLPQGKRKKDKLSKKDERKSKGVSDSLLEMKTSEHDDTLNEVEILHPSEIDGSKVVSFNNEVLEGIFEDDDDFNKSI